MALPYETVHAFTCRRCGVTREIDKFGVFKTDECPECGPGPLCLKCCSCHAEAPASLEFAV